MPTRIGDLAQHRMMTDRIVAAQARVRETQAQLGSGKRAERFRDIAPDTERLLAAKDALYRGERYLHNNRIVDARLQVMEDAVSSLSDIGGRLRVLLLQRLDGASAAPGVVATEAGQLLAEAVNQLNADLGGRYLFAGSRTDAPPVALDPAFAAFGGPDDTYYQGDAVELSVRADDDLEVAYGVTADAPGFCQLIGALRAAIEGDRTLDDGLLEDALGLVNGALDGIEDRRSAIGASRGMLERANVAHEDTRLLLQKVVGDVEDVDMAEAVTRMVQHQTTLQSAMLTLSRLEQLSLANYLR